MTFFNAGRTVERLKKGDIVPYRSQTHEVVAVYPYTAYLKNLSTKEVECAGIGDLVIAGLEPQLSQKGYAPSTYTLQAIKF